MMGGFTIVGLISVALSLVLAVRALRSHGLSFENKAWMAVVWALLIAALAFVLERVGP